MRLVNKPINVELEEESRYRPRTLHTHLGTLHVRSRLDFWVVQTKWWGGEIRRIYLLLETSHGVVEVYTNGERWWLWRIED